MTANHPYDAVVIGAGPAGSIAARRLALEGHRVALVDRASFPRAKVCGCCLSNACLAELAREDLAELASRCGARPIRGFRVLAGRSMVSLPADGAALSRRAFDDALRIAACEAGATFVGGASASVSPPEGHRPVRVELLGGRMLEARLVLVADGLAGGSLAKIPCFAPTRARASHMGAGAIIRAGCDRFETSVIHMATAEDGYVGLVRIEDGSLNVAAALNPEACRAAGGPGSLSARILARAGVAPPPGLEAASWHGTPLLTSHRAQLEHGPVMVLGDAAGYVEPFTGQGMTWAVASGALAARVAGAKLRGEIPMDAPEWSRAHARHIAPRQRACRAVSWGLRRPLVVRAAMMTLGVWPRAAAPMVRLLDWSPTAPPAAQGSVT